MYAAWKAEPSPAALRAVVDSQAKAINSAVSAYAGQLATPSLRRRARLIAAKAVETYQPGKASLSTHMNRQLQQLRRIAPDLANPLPKPERLRREAAQLYQAEKELTDKMGRAPSTPELADYANVDIAHLWRLRRRDAAALSSSSIQGDPDKDDSWSDASELGQEGRTADERWADYVYHDLGDIDKVVFEHRMGYRGSRRLSNAEIAKKLRVSPAAVSQRVTKIQKMLDGLYDE